MVSRQAELSTGFGGNIRSPVQCGVLDSLVELRVLLLEVFPNGSAILLIFVGLFHAQENRADAHHHGEVVEHVTFEFFGLDFGSVHRIDHDARHAKLLVAAGIHDLFIHALIFAADEVAIHVYVEVIHGADARKRLKHENVIYVERVLGKLQAQILQQLGAVNHRMHEQVLRLAEMLRVVPAKFLAYGENVFVSHDGASAFMHFFIDIIADHHIGRLGEFHLTAQVCHNLMHGVFVEPVIGIDDLEVAALGVGEAGIDSRAMAAVGLMDCANCARVLFLPSIGDFGRIVFRGTVINDKNLNVVFALVACEQRFDALVHVCCGVVARNGERNGFHFSSPFEAMHRNAYDLGIIHIDRAKRESHAPFAPAIP